MSTPKKEAYPYSTRRHDRQERRESAKRRWPYGRALALLAKYYRVVDRMKGFSPAGGTWSTPLRFVSTGFRPGSRSFNDEMEKVDRLRPKRVPNFGYVSRLRWNLARMAKDLRRRRWELPNE